MNVSEWYRALREKSVTTADLYLSRLEKFCKDTGFSPNQLLELDDEEIKRLVLDHISDKKGSYANSYYYALRSWLEFSGRELRIKPAERAGGRREIPTPKRLGEILAVSEPKAKVAISLLAFSGLELHVLGNYDGSGGLTLGDIPELRLNDDDVELSSRPARIVVKREGDGHFTFLNSKGCDYLLAWLRMRMRKGEKLTPDSPLIPSRSGGFLKTKSVSKMIRKAIRAAGYDYSPSSLRQYFIKRMQKAEEAGVVPREYWVFWTGQKGYLTQQYAQGELLDDVVLDMRERYRKASKFLVVEGGAKKKIREKRQKVVTLDELESYLEEGWLFVTLLPNGKVIIET